ncbi:peptidoglycan-binding protein [uncultured Actinomyces sp.]|uniref:peptidoglycan-binding domain-containing protein n=1 Tax=uncultured Actinomyces sp. TaxID=249061 RepID=UPI00261A235D|nr:peptidoglycan-binding protein [uncultured Actinomyces sp.]
MPASTTPQRKPGKRRTGLFLAGFALILILAVALTWIIAWKVQSPAQREASAEPPEPLPITIPIDRGDLQDSKFVSATVKGATTSEITIPRQSDVSVVSQLGINTGETLNAGNVVTWINGRPVIALKGAFPLWRDLSEGDKGEDVRELQVALNELGYGIATDGVFGPRTASSIQKLYKAIGSEAVRTDPAPAPSDDVQPNQGDAARSPQPTQTPKVVTVPKTEIIMLTSMPVTVTSIPAVGTVLDEENSKMLLGTGDISVTGTVGGADATVLEAGMKARAFVENQEVSLSLEKIEAAADSDQASPDNSSVVTFKVTENAEALRSLIDTDQPIRVEVALSEPLTDVLIVPERAIASDANGNLTVLVKSGESEFQVTEIEQLGCANGTCAIRSEDETVSEGAQVRVDR